MDARLRPIGPRDANLLQAFVRNLSPEARRLRFQSGLVELQPEMLVRLTRGGGSYVAIAAVVCADGQEKMVGEARYAPAVDGTDSSEFALAVADEYQHTGLGTELLGRLQRHARCAGIARLHGDVLRENTGMLGLAQALGFRLRRHPDGGWLVRVAMDLRADAGTATLPPPSGALLPH